MFRVNSKQPTACFLLISCMVYSLTLKTEAVFSPKTPVNFHHIMLHHISEGSTPKPPNDMNIGK
jgi:hypothetical protein